MTMFRLGRSLSRVFAFGGVVLLLVLAFAYGVGVGVYHWPPFAAMQKLKASVLNPARDESPIAEAAAEIASLARKQAGPSKAAQARFAREFVFSHSLHQLDSEHARYAWDTRAVLAMLYEHYLTRQNPPHLSCGPRALALRAVLDALGIESRTVHVFTGDYDEIRSHTFLEVFDEDSARWVIHDPGNDVSYVEARTSEPVSLIRLVFGDVQSVVPVSQRGRGWELNEIDYLQSHYFQAAKYDSADGSPDLVIVNTDRFSVAKRFPANDNMTFVEFSQKNYRRPAFLLNNAIPSLGRQAPDARPAKENAPARLRGLP
jgi:hypothetical protein